MKDVPYELSFPLTFTIMVVCTIKYFVDISEMFQCTLYPNIGLLPPINFSVFYLLSS